MDLDVLVADRNEKLVALTAFCRTNPYTSGALLVGSATVGFTDAYSDIDLVVVAEHNDQARLVESVMELLRGYGAVFITDWKHRDGLNVVCCLLDSYLEIDLGVWAVDLLFASSPDWRLLAARTDQAGEVITKAMETNPRLARSSPAEPSGDDYLWQEVIGSFVAHQRDPEEAVSPDLRGRIATALYSANQKSLLQNLLDS